MRFIRAQILRISDPNAKKNQVANRCHLRYKKTSGKFGNLIKCFYLYIMKMRDKYKIAKEAKVGDEVVCPSCGTKFIKSSYQQAFCKTKNGTVCKDKYWNTVIPTKRNNTTRISPANRFYKENVIDPMRERQIFEGEDYDPGDSEYWDNSDNFHSY